MDIIQKTVTLFSDLLQKVKTIGNLIRTNCLPVLDESEVTEKIFWIFNL